MLRASLSAQERGEKKRPPLHNQPRPIPPRFSILPGLLQAGRGPWQAIEQGSLAEGPGEAREGQRARLHIAGRQPRHKPGSTGLTHLFCQSN